MARKKNSKSTAARNNSNGNSAAADDNTSTKAEAVTSNGDSNSSGNDAAASAMKPPTSTSTPSSSQPGSPSSASSDSAPNDSSERSASQLADIDAPSTATLSSCYSSSNSTAATNGSNAAVAKVSTDSCCSSKKEATPAPVDVKSGCCSSKKEATPAPIDFKSGCGGAAKKATTDSCCSSKKEPVAVEAKTGCCSSKKELSPTLVNVKSCCSAKAEAATPVKAGCCSSKQATPAASTGCSSNRVAKNAASSDSCCSAKPSATAVDSHHPDRVRERLFDRMTEFKNERGASMAVNTKANANSGCSGNGNATPRKAKTGANHHRNGPSNDDAVTLRLSIGGMTCSGCCTRIEKFMERRSGIVDVNISLLTSRGVFVYDPNVLTAKALEDMVVSLGFTAGVLPDESLVSINLHIGYESPVRVRALLLDIVGVVAAEETTDIAAATDADASTSTLPPVSPVSKARAKSFVGTQRAVVVDYDPELTGARQIVRQLSKLLGFQVYASSPRPLAVRNEEADVAKYKRYLAASVALALPIVVLEYVLPLLLVVGATNPATRDVVKGLNYVDLVGFLCATPILFVIAYPIHESAYLALRYSSRVTMDVLISLSSFTAYAFSVVTVVLAMVSTVPERSETFFEVTAMLVTLILVGRFIEKIVKAKASNSVDALLRIQAKTAILLENSSASSLHESYIDVILVERDDLLRVLPGTRIPTDGIVVDGASSVDESMVTGEARKVAKTVGSTVIGGTINAHGVLVVRVTHTITESMLARIVNLVDEAQSSKCKSQTVADVVAAYFTTFIITLAAVVFGVWYHLAKTGAVDTHGWAPLPFALRFAITVLVISCPCAISLAVPTAIMVATTIGSQFGVLFKGGQAIEALEKVDVVMFDKTGTLTTGQLAVVDTVLASSDVDVRELWAAVAATELNSEHAIGRALVAHARQLHAPELAATVFAAVPGCGVTAHVGAKSVCIGSLKWLVDVRKVDVPVELRDANVRLQQRGCVVICVAVEHELIAVVALRDTPRPEARLVIEELRRKKVQTWIVTGDQRETALAIAAQLGVPEFLVIADALPHQKIDKVRLLQSIGKNVAFVGDGVNDGPALAMANVGIAVGAGTDVALESADLVLVKDDLRDLLNAHDLSRATNRMIKWNFSWGFAYNLLLMPLACGALYPITGTAIPPALAGLSELLSSVPVILFSLLLNYWRPPFANTNAAGGASGHGGDVVIQIDAPSHEKTPLLATK